MATTACNMNMDPFSNTYPTTVSPLVLGGSTNFGLEFIRHSSHSCQGEGKLSCGHPLRYNSVLTVYLLNIVKVNLMSFQYAFIDYVCGSFICVSRLK